MIRRHKLEKKVDGDRKEEKLRKQLNGIKANPKAIPAGKIYTSCVEIEETKIGRR